MAAVAYTPAQLNSMDLHPGDASVERLTSGNYTRRLQLQDALKVTNQEGKIAAIGDDIFATRQATNTTSARCNYSINLVQCTGNIPGAGPQGGVLVIPTDTYMFFEEQTIWSKNNLTHSKGQDKYTQHLQISSPPSCYPVTQYFNYVPKNVWASDRHQTAYLDKHKPTHQALTLDMITDMYFTFKCSLELAHQEDLDEHAEAVHGIIPANLTALTTIEIDTKQPFSLDPALHIEQTSPEEQDKILNGWFTRTVGRGVVIKSTNKDNSDLNESRSNEFLREVEKSTTKTFNSRFVMELRTVLKGAHLNYAFPAKWHQIEEAFYAALGSDQSIKRWSSHFANGPSSFTNRPMDQAIHDIDVEVDKAHGTSNATFKDAKGRVQSVVTHRLLAKYRLIFEVTEQLPTEVKQMRHFICQSASSIMSDLTLLIDIQDFKKNLKTEFTGKGNLADYESFLIPASKKKNLGVNGAGIKEDKRSKSEESNQVYKEYSKERHPIDVDDRIKKNLKAMAETKAKDLTIKDNEVWRDTDIAEVNRKEKINSCYCCASPNCLIKQKICMKLGVPKQYVNGCKGKVAKFGDLSNYGLPFQHRFTKKKRVNLKLTEALLLL